MTDKPRKPAWWLLYALVPVMGALLVVESRALLSPGWHKGAQVGIILFVYGLVWVWIWANDLALLRDRQDGCQDDGRHPRERSDRATSWSLDPGFRLSQTDGSGARAYATPRRTDRRSTGREIRKCSRNLDQPLRR